MPSPGPRLPRKHLLLQHLSQRGHFRTVARSTFVQRVLLHAWALVQHAQSENFNKFRKETGHANKGVKEKIKIANNGHIIEQRSEETVGRFIPSQWMIINAHH